MSIENDDINIDRAIEKCITCRDALLTANAFNEMYTSLRHKKVITPQSVDDAFAEVVDTSLAYSCKDCPNMLYE